MVLPFSLTGGVRGVSRLRFPPGPHLRSSRFSRHPRLRQAPTRSFAKNRNLRGFWWAASQALGAGLQAPWRPGPQAPGTWNDTLTKTLASADLGGLWMVSEGAALQSYERRGSRLRSSISAAGPGPNIWGPGQQAPEPCIPAA